MPREQGQELIFSTPCESLAVVWLPIARGRRRALEKVPCRESIRVERYYHQCPTLLMARRKAHGIHVQRRTNSPPAPGKQILTQKTLSSRQLDLTTA